MFIISHILAGFIVGKLTGNYLFALLGAILIDIDHIFVYAKKGVLFDIKELFKLVVDRNDPYGTQRNYLHSIFFWVIISGVSILASFSNGIALSLGYLSHLILDTLDGSDFYPLYPMKFKVNGPIEYMSKGEFVFTVLLGIFFVILLRVK